MSKNAAQTHLSATQLLMALFDFVLPKGRTPAFPMLYTPAEIQHRQLLALIRKAQDTAFGRYYHFKDLLHRPNLIQHFQSSVPAVDYNKHYDRWWSKAYLCDDPDVCWPGVIPYYALSSGTSQAATKYIPVTFEMLRSIKKGTRRLLLDVARTPHMPVRQFARKMLMVGSCTAIKPEGRHFTGDLSGIIGHNRPFWIERNYAPGRSISDLPNWDDRIQAIVHEAPNWDVGFAVGSVAWVQLIFERIIETYKLDNIHQIWKNLDVFVHGGVFFEPYRHSFEKLLDRPIMTFDSYLASEGFISYQNRVDTKSMKLMPDCGIFFEFVPFNEQNFDENGELRSEFPEARTVGELEEHVNYALLLSTNAGAWRYLLGDTVQVTDVEKCEIRITGRTKQFLSMCGEHISVDNLNEAVRRVDDRTNAGIREFAVAGVPYGNQWAHQWWVSFDNPVLSAEEFARLVDAELCILNDDYCVERKYALRDVRASILPNALFYKWLEHRGKANGQSKIPRVLKGKQLEDFQQFVAQNAG
ncbi:MAG: GH3 auxin-responsive promoter family protein [Bacteroidetes bacterium]|nr:GH3 auxin-responsive promoter family protein [Bacteroidota bacterium]